MCVVSMVADHYNEKWDFGKLTFELPIARAEFEALKKDVEELKVLLKRAKLYDEKNNEPNCEMEEKIAKLRKVAELVGVNLDEVLNAGK